MCLFLTHPLCLFHTSMLLPYARISKAINFFLSPFNELLQCLGDDVADVVKGNE